MAVRYDSPSIIDDHGSFQFSVLITQDHCTRSSCMTIDWWPDTIVVVVVEAVWQPSLRNAWRSKLWCLQTGDPTPTLHLGKHEAKAAVSPHKQSKNGRVHCFIVFKCFRIVLVHHMSSRAEKPIRDVCYPSHTALAPETEIQTGAKRPKKRKIRCVHGHGIMIPIFQGPKKYLP